MLTTAPLCPLYRKQSLTILNWCSNCIHSLKRQKKRGSHGEPGGILWVTFLEVFTLLVTGTNNAVVFCIVCLTRYNIHYLSKGIQKVTNVQYVLNLFCLNMKLHWNQLQTCSLINPVNMLNLQMQVPLQDKQVKWSSTDQSSTCLCCYFLNF